MKKFMLGVMMLFAYGQAMAMDKSLEALKNEIDVRAKAWGSRYASDLIYNLHKSAIACGAYTTEAAEKSIAKFQPFWIQACKAHALKEMKKGVLFSEILALPVKSLTSNDNFFSKLTPEEERYQDLCQYYREAQKPEKTLEKAIEKDWQDICTMIKNGHFVLIKK